MRSNATSEKSAEEIVALLGLIPHPEGGFYRETFRAPAAEGARGASTAIYYLLRAEDVSAWHRTDADEIWHHYAGAPLELSLSGDGGERSTVRIGQDLAHRAESLPQGFDEDGGKRQHQHHAQKGDDHDEH